MQAHAGRPRNQPVGNHRRQQPRNERVLPVLPPAADDVEPAFERVTMAGMSRGSFCRSPSDVTMSGPRAYANPAANAAVWPKLRRKRITRRRGSRPGSAPGSRSCRPCFRLDDDHFVGTAPGLQRVGELRAAPRAMAPRSESGSRRSARSFSGSYGYIISVLTVDSAVASSARADRRRPGREHAHQRRPRGSRWRAGYRSPLAVPEGEQARAKYRMPRPMAIARRRAPDPRGAGEQHEDLERRRRRQHRRNQDRHHPEAPKRRQRPFDPAAVKRRMMSGSPPCGRLVQRRQPATDRMASRRTRASAALCASPSR